MFYDSRIECCVELQYWLYTELSSIIDNISIKQPQINYRYNFHFSKSKSLNFNICCHIYFFNLGYLFLSQNIAFSPIFSGNWANASFVRVTWASENKLTNEAPITQTGWVVYAEIARNAKLGFDWLAELSD